MKRRILVTNESKGGSLEETILESLCQHLSLSIQEAKVELQIKLCEKYLHDARDLLVKKDYLQAGEKFWGASAQIVKAVAAKKDSA